MARRTDQNALRKQNGYRKSLSDREDSKRIAEFQTDYKGEIKLAKKYSINPVKDIYAKLVREGDDFEEYIKDGHQTINFKPKSFNNGEIIGAFAVCLFQDGGMIYEAMSKEEIEEVEETQEDLIAKLVKEKEAKIEREIAMEESEISLEDEIKLIVSKNTDETTELIKTWLNE